MEKIIVSCLESRVESNRSIYARFLLGPFTEDYAVTVGTALRRALLSKVKNIAITAIHIQGVTHEFSTIVGVRESVLDLALNFQQIVLRTRTLVRSTTESSTDEGVFANPVRVESDASLAVDLHDREKQTQSVSLRFTNQKGDTKQSTAKTKFLQATYSQGYSSSKGGRSFAQRVGIRYALQTRRGLCKSFGFAKTPITSSLQSEALHRTGFVRAMFSEARRCKNEVFACKAQRVRKNQGPFKRGVVPFLKFNYAPQRKYVSTSNSSVKRSRVHKSDAKTKFAFSGVSLPLAPQAAPTLQTSSFEFESEIAQVGYLQMQGPAVIHANDLKLPLGIECVDPTQYIATLSQEGLLVVKFLISKKKTSFNKNNDTLTSTKINTTDLRICLDKNELLENYNRYSFTLLGQGSYTKRLAKTYSYKARFGKKSSLINQSLISVYKPYSFTTLFSKLIYPELRLRYLLNVVKKNNFFKLRWNNILTIETLRELYSLKDLERSSGKKNRKMGNLARTPFFSPLRLRANKAIRTISFRPKPHMSTSNFRSFDSAICLRNTMFLDPIFNSVFQVNYVVEKDDLCNQPRERIILELWTNGSIHPRQAIHQALFSLISTFSIFRKAFDLDSL